MAGQEIVQGATHGQLEAALLRANQMGQGDNELLGRDLSELGHSVPELVARQQRVGNAWLSDESHFGACIHRIYAVRRSDGNTLYWDLKFHRTSTGWTLDAIKVRS